MRVNRFEAVGIKCIEVVPEEAEGRELPLLVVLHGWGDYGESYVDFAPMINATDYRYVFPTGPLKVPGAYNGWFELDYSFRNFDQRAASFRPTGLKLLDALGQRFNTPASRTVLGGFSQGGMVTYDVGLHYRDPQGGHLAALIGLSSVVPADNPPSQAEYFQRMAELPGLPVFIAHGRQDTVINLQLGQISRDFLQSGGLKVEYYEFEGGHQIEMGEVALLQKFLTNVI